MQEEVGTSYTVGNSLRFPFYADCIIVVKRYSVVGGGIMRTRKTLVWVFFLTAVIAALIYWAIWMQNPDYFVVQQEVNLYPVASLQTFMWKEPPSDLPDQLTGLTDMYKEVLPLLAIAKRLREEQARVGIDIDRLEKDLGEISKVLEANRTKRIEEFRQREIEPLERERAQIQELITALQAGPSRPPVRFGPRVVVADRRAQLAQYELRMAQKRVEIADRVVREYAGFARTEDLQKWKRLEEQVRSAKDLLSVLDKERADLREQAAKLGAKWKGDRVGRLGLLDFVYFSLGVSTTTTFGDIIPNHTVTRTLVTIQLLISVVTMGLFVNSLSRR
jgi:hypothetical protein